MSTENVHNRRKNRAESPLRDRIGKLLGIPADAVGISNGFMAEMRGRSGVSVRGCKKILSYSAEEIRLLTKDGTVAISGDKLTCTAYFSDAIGIEGRIDGISFDDRRDTLSRCPSSPECEGRDGT